jgi:hypothetical protein
VAGDLLGAEPARDLRRAQVAFSLVRCGRYAQVRQEPQDIVLAVVQAFQRQPGRRLLLVRAGDAAYSGQAGQDAMAEQPQITGGAFIYTSGEARPGESLTTKIGQELKSFGHT